MGKRPRDPPSNAIRRGGFYSHVSDAAAVLQAVESWSHRTAPLADSRATGERPRAHANGAHSRDEHRAAADAELLEAIRPVLQPGPTTYDGYGVARPSAFVLGGTHHFAAKLAKVMNDRGGPGSWMWKPVPKELLHQGTVRQEGGRAAELARQMQQRKQKAADAKRLRDKKSKERARMESLADEFRGQAGPLMRHHKPQQSGGDDAREAALQAYRLMKARKGGGRHPARG